MSLITNLLNGKNIIHEVVCQKALDQFVAHVSECDECKTKLAELEKLSPMLSGFLQPLKGKDHA